MNEDERRSAIAHDLKTPIAVIAGYAELLATRDDEETRMKAAEQILAAARRLATTVDDLFGVDGDAPAEEERVVEWPVGTAARRAVRPARIVLVDDDVFVRQLLRLTLPSGDYELAEASDGDEGLELVEAYHPDLVLLDWRMPTVSGGEVLSRLKERRPDWPVVVLTAAGEERAHARTLGADAFLVKPFSPRELLETIEALIRSPPDS